MSASNLEKNIEQIRKKMGLGFTYSEYKIGFNAAFITNQFLQDVNALQTEYGKFIGRAKALNKGDQELIDYSAYISDCFEGLIKTSQADTCFQLVNLATGKIAQLIAYTETLESIPRDVVPKLLFDQAVAEKEQFEKTAEFLAKHGNMPEINSLIENGYKIGLPIDRHWVLALCSINLIEATVNLKLEKMGLKAEGSFKEKYRKLCSSIEEQENRELFKLLPTALYDGVRNKLDHASNSNKVTEKEAKEINQFVLRFIGEVFC